MRLQALVFSALCLCSCGGDESSSPTSPTPQPARCQLEQTATVSVRNGSTGNAEVVLDGETIGLLLPGESKSFTITAVTSHTLIVRDLSNCFLGICAQCDWTVSLPVCSTKSYACVES